MRTIVGDMTRIVVKKKHGSRVVPQFLRDLLQGCGLERDDWYDDLLTHEAPFFGNARNAVWAQMTALERAKWLTGQLYNDTGIMPWSLCEDLCLPQGSSYAQGARKLRVRLPPEVRQMVKTQLAVR
jgi:hypothetical protein